MKNRTLNLTLVLLVLVGLAFTAGPDNRREFEISKNLEIFANVYKELNNGFVDEIDPGKIMRIGLEAMVASLDPFTNYIAESDIERYRILAEGKSNSAGLDFRQVGDYATVVELYEGQPADQAGIKVGDQIVSIDGRDTKGKSTEEVDFFLRGASGTAVELTLRRPGQKNEIKVKLNRGDFEIPNVPYSGLLEGDIAYVSLTTFTREAGRNVGNAIRDMRKENPNIKGIILDLRDNGGGLLNEAVSVCNVFIPKGELVVLTKGRIKERDLSFRTPGSAIEEELPLTVLINKRSASASEIVSGVMQDYDRGVLIGQRSYGKGLVQNTLDVGYNSKLKFTSSKYYIPSGRCIQSVRYENGEPVELPISERVAFETRNHRAVYDGGGVDPDLEVQQPDNIPVIKALNQQDVIFRFVSQYCAGKESMPSLEDLHFTEFDSFLTFLQKEGVIFRTESEKILEQLKAETAKEGYALDGAIKSLDNALQQAQLDNIRQYKTILTNLIEKEIAARYYYANGRVRIGLRNDPEVKEAIKLLRDDKRYRQILGQK
ncbi:MAG: S41 family peptidase [Lewinellaceae bacterium]|nr:S41 family peptidase [Lewinellaceae bacterium]